MDPPHLDILSAIQSDGKQFVSPAALEKFHNANTDYMCFEIIYYDLVKSNFLPHDKTKEQQKTVDKSNYFSLKGDNAIATPDLQGALIWYTKSIAAAPYPISQTDVSTELAVAFGKRSAVYKEMGKYEAALKDIENAFSFHYPRHLKYDLMIKRFECFVELGNLDEAQDSLDEAENFMNLCGQLDSKCALLLKANKLLLYTAYFTKMFREEQDDTEENKTDEATYQKPRPSKTYGEHPEIPAASDCLEIKYNKKFGRHLVSTREINPGDILVIEEPYVSTLHPDYYNTHCYNCLKRSDAMIPCKHCALAQFCSADCRETSWADFHDVECPILPYVNRSETDYIPPLALRMLLTATKTIAKNNLQNLFDKITFLEENNMFFGATTGYNKNHQYSSSSYLTAHLLYRNSIHNLYDDPSKLNVSYYLVAAIIVEYLDRHTDFFRPPITPASPPPTDPDVEWKIFVGSMFTLYTSIVSTNGFAAVEHQLDSSTNESQLGRIGSGVYNTLALLNHSCFNNVQTFVADGRTQVLYAIRPIRKGEQLFINYGCFYSSQGLEQRMKELKHHHFTCECQACAEDWPREEFLYSVRPTVICTECRLPLTPRPPANRFRCPRCEAEKDPVALRRRLGEIHARGTEIKEEMFTPAGLQRDYAAELSRHLEFVSRHFKMPLVTMLLLEDVLMENVCSRMGNHHMYSPGTETVEESEPRENERER